MSSVSLKSKQWFLCIYILFMVVLILSSCQEPKVVIEDIAISAISPKGQNVEKIQAGETVFIEAQVTKVPQLLDVDYKWETNGGVFKPTSEREPSGYYTAPKEAGEKFFITLITLYKDKEMSRKSVPISIVEKPGMVSEQKPSEATMPLESLEKTSLLSSIEKKELITIVAPDDESEVRMITSVSGRVKELKSSHHLVILGKRSSDKQWQVKAVDPIIQSGGTWIIDEIQLGEPQDAGQNFQIIAIITNQNLSPEQFLENLPAEQSKIVSVKRRVEVSKAIAIIDPKDGAAVDMIISIKGKVKRLLPNENLVVLIRPMPDDSNQSWWVQTQAVISQDGTWTSSPVYVGISDDKSGFPFRICAVITTRKLSPGDQLPTPPPGPSDTISVKRR